MREELGLIYLPTSNATPTISEVIDQTPWKNTKLIVALEVQQEGQMAFSDDPS